MIGEVGVVKERWKDVMLKGSGARAFTQRGGGSLGIGF